MFSHHLKMAFFPCGLCFWRWSLFISHIPCMQNLYSLNTFHIFFSWLTFLQVSIKMCLSMIFFAFKFWVSMSFLNLWLDVSHQFWVIMTLSLQKFSPLSPIFCWFSNYSYINSTNLRNPAHKMCFMYVFSLNNICDHLQIRIGLN